MVALSVQFSCSVLSDSLWLWTAACQTSLSITNSQSLLRLMSIKSVMPSNHLILCHPLLLPSILPSIRVFSRESVLRIRWPKYWSFSFSISPSNDYSGLIFFRIDWLDFLAIQGTLKSLCQHHSSKASILQCSDFLIQLSHPYKTAGKIIHLTRQTFIDKVMSLLFNMLSFGHSFSSKELLLLLLLSRFSRVQLWATPETAAHQAPPSLGFCLYTFLFLGDGLCHHLLYNVTNLRP